MDDHISSAEFNKLLTGFVAKAHDEDNRYSMTLAMNQGILVVTIVGTVLQPIAEEFAERIDDLFAYTPARRAAIDLSTCDYLSSSAFGVLMEFFKASNRRGGQIILIGPSLKVRKLLEILSMDQFFLIVDDLEMAHGYFRESDKMPAMNQPRRPITPTG